jgi:hypothetical protein
LRSSQSPPDPPRKTTSPPTTVSTTGAPFYRGQQLLVHRPTRTVIARFSTWPERWDDRLSRYADVANRAVLERLGAVQRD